VPSASPSPSPPARASTSTRRSAPSPRSSRGSSSASERRHARQAARGRPVALFELASGALHTLNADEVVRLTAASLQRQLEFDQVQAFRYHADRGRSSTSSGRGRLRAPAAGSCRAAPADRHRRHPRARLAAHGPAFDDDEMDESKGPRRRRRLAIPLEQGETVFGFLTMSRRGAFVLTAQEMRLVQELARLAAGASRRHASSRPNGAAPSASRS